MEIQKKKQTKLYEIYSEIEGYCADKKEFCAEKIKERLDKLDKSDKLDMIRFSPNDKNFSRRKSSIESIPLSFSLYKEEFPLILWNNNISHDENLRRISSVKIDDMTKKLMNMLDNYFMVLKDMDIDHEYYIDRLKKYVDNSVLNINKLPDKDIRKIYTQENDEKKLDDDYEFLTEEELERMMKERDEKEKIMKRANIGDNNSLKVYSLPIEDPRNVLDNLIKKYRKNNVGKKLDDDLTEEELERMMREQNINTIQDMIRSDRKIRQDRLRQRGPASKRNS